MGNCSIRFTYTPTLQFSSELVAFSECSRAYGVTEADGNYFKLYYKPSFLVNTTNKKINFSKSEQYLQKDWCNLYLILIFPKERHVLTLRFLATGLPSLRLSLTFRMTTSCVSAVIKETIVVLWHVFSLIHMPFPSHDEFLQISEDFYTKWGMPHCLRAIDGRHVRIRKPAKFN
ncbi:hypothetical protein TKK_0006074 [Trichogramma kaykai]